MKTGRLSKADWKYIEANADNMTAEQLAKKLSRGVDAIEKHLKKIGKYKVKRESLEVQAEYDIKSRPYWRQIKLQFSEDELELFLYHWKQIVAQFKKDVLATEELQIIDTVKLEVLMNRALQEQQDSMNRIIELEKEMAKERRKAPQDQDKEEIFNLERQIASLRAAKEGLSREFKELQTKKSALFKDMKATRAERIDKIESNKETFSGLVQKILRDPEFFENEGKELEKMRLAVLKEKERLSQYHKYDDGMVDQPMLNCDTVIVKGQEDDTEKT